MQHENFLHPGKNTFIAGCKSVCTDCVGAKKITQMAWALFKALWDVENVYLYIYIMTYLCAKSEQTW